MKQRHKHYFIIWAILFGVIGVGFSQEDPQITTITPYRSGDSLMCQFNTENLFSGKIESALLSGLPILVDVRTELHPKTAFKAASLRHQITYDIWEDQFLIKTPTSEIIFTDMDSLRKHWQPFSGVVVAHFANLPDQKKLSIQVYLNIVLLTRGQGEKLKNWILNAYETEENRPSQERDTGFKLNINQVVSLLFQKSDVMESFQAQHRIQIADLTQIPQKR